MKRLGIILSHPVQYYAPLFRYLAREIDIVVFYGHKPNPEEQGRSGFGTAFSWDIDLLSDYKHVFLQNRSKSLEFNHFNGISVPDVGRILKENNVSHVLILGWQYRFYLQALWYCKLHRIPVAVRGDSHLFVQRNLIKRLIKKIGYPFLLNFYSRLFFVGTWNKDYLLNYRIDSSKLLYAPHAVDQDFWKSATKKKSGETLNFIWVGKFIDIKRPVDAIKAFQKYLSLSEVKASLTMIGTGPLLDNCKKIASADDDIIFEGFKNQSELLGYYQESHCLILTSTSETWGLVVNEAFSCGIPAIVSDACGCAPDMIMENSGLTYPMGDIEALGSAMYEVATNLNREPDYYKKGIEDANRKHHFSETARALKDFLHLPS